MESINKHPLKDGIFLSGLICIALSAGIFILPAFQANTSNTDSSFGLFLIHYLIAGLYAIIIATQSAIKFRWNLAKNNITYTLLFLVLSLISAYALNREMVVFQESTQWLCAYLVIVCVSCIAYGFVQYLPVISRHILYFILGAGFLLFVYFSIYLIPIYGFGLIGFFLLGFSLHAFVPLLFSIYLFLLFKKAYSTNKHFLWSILTGITLPLLFFFYFLSGWISTQQQITNTQDQLIMESNTRLPQWVLISQQLSGNWITDRVIKSRLVYDMPQKDNGFWEMPSRSFDEIKKHDPLVMAAAYLYDTHELEDNERIKILEVLYDGRHKAQDHLWSGKDLKTSHVITNARVFPQYRMAYTEKIISIQHTGRQQSWRNNEQEAIYTFHMPEGSVVTSLSLWINGVEEKAYLTTKSKADSAYKTIVGVEVRDPSVVHWQEGNTVSVRVFPCTPAANRRFKIGFTSPLRKDKDSLVYENIYFQGPSFENASESIQVQFDNQPAHPGIPLAFITTKTQTYQYKGSYKPEWEITCQSPPLSNAAFSFDGKSYFLEEYKEQYAPFIPQEIYLDINQSWTQIEFDQIWALVKAKKVYAYTDKLTLVTEENKDIIFNQLQPLTFSLFPFQEISHPENALVVSKSESSSPNLHDIKGSEFSHSLKEHLREKYSIRLFNLGHQLSPYLKTLNECRVFTYAQGELSTLAQLLMERKFVKTQENHQSIVINQAQLKIIEQAGLLPSQAPDHLLRLFAYNHIMQQVSASYLADNFITDELIAQAEKAYVVSPVSSLIVLETQKDYDRFDIQASKNSLKNAAMKSSGAVPEPHEWMLIILTIVVVSIFLFKQYVWR